MRQNSSLVLALILSSLIAPAAPAQTFKAHVAVAQETHAADAGRDAMRAGGNAVDAAVAVAFALAVTHPAAGNIGGGGFLVAFDARTKAVRTFDFRESAPAASSERMYLSESGTLLPKHRAGPRAAGVPGTVRGLALAHKEMGRRPWAELVAPAARLAREGFVISPSLARGLNGQLFRDAPKAGIPEDLGPEADTLADFPASVAAYRRADGRPWTGGERLVQPDLADTLDRIARDGPDEFYTGRTARLIADDSARNRGLITMGDLAAYRAKERPPIRGTFRGFEVCGMGPPASGGIIIVEILNILERYDLKADGPRSGRTVHRVAEAMRRAYFDRASKIADPDFTPVPIDDLISKSHADALAATITDDATPSASLAPFPIADRPEGADTTHLSTMDAEGNAVALTYTLEEGYGSKSVVPGAGFLLNNEMGDFNLIPGRTDARGRIGTPPNVIAPGKRMLSSQAPTIVLKDGKVRLVTGSPGGRTIPNTTLWVILYALEFGLDGRGAVDGPRTHHQWMPDTLTLEGDSWGPAARDDLSRRGHVLRRVAIQGDAHSIFVDPATGLLQGAPDRRRQTSMASGD